ncbi:MAG: glycosyltransferase family 39 protein [Limibacillus sp.]
MSTASTPDGKTGTFPIFWPLSAFGAVLLSAGLLTVGLAARPPMAVVETRLLSVAWEMWRDGSFLIPQLNGEAYLQKPPLLAWLIHLVWSVTGVSELAARLVAPAFGLLSILLVAPLARLLWPERHAPALLAPWILATTMLFASLSSLTMYDAPLTAMTLLALIFALRARGSEGILNWLLMGLALGAAFLFKGPAIVIHVAPLVLCLPFLAEGNRRPEWRRWYRGLLIAGASGAAVALCWLVPATVAAGLPFLESFFWNLGAGRVVESIDHQAPFWFFAALIPVFLWPWGWYLPVWPSLFRDRPWADEGLRFCLFWIASAFLIHSALSGKQLHYLLPELPALALVFARVWPWGTQASRYWRLLTALPVALSVFAGLIFATGWLPFEKADPFLPSFTNVAIAAGLTGLLFLLLALIRYSAIALVLVAPVALVVVHLLAGDLLRSYGNQEIARFIAQHEEAGIAYRGVEYHGEFTFTGRLTRPLEVFWHPQHMRQWAQRHPGAVIISKEGREGPGYDPVLESLFRGTTYRVWIVPEKQKKTGGDKAGGTKQQVQ